MPKKNNRTKKFHESHWFIDVCNFIMSEKKYDGIFRYCRQYRVVVTIFFFALLCLPNLTIDTIWNCYKFLLLLIEWWLIFFLSFKSFFHIHSIHSSKFIFNDGYHLIYIYANLFSFNSDYLVIIMDQSALYRYYYCSLLLLLSVQ